jgi:hypothetical protein
MNYWHVFIYLIYHGDREVRGITSVVHLNTGVVGSNPIWDMYVCVSVLVAALRQADPLSKES